ncbi:MAG: TonB-dependent receptor [Planctomycetes bacterium]|nr:TonB-dependent receptor [Planctomycetota bacterium]
MASTVALLLAAFGPASAASAADGSDTGLFSTQVDESGKEEPAKGDLSELSIEELMNVEVTSASKKGQKLSDVAAAIYVLTQEDIHRSGVRSIPEALRMVPGLDVAQLNSNQWAISSRGFNSVFSNKLLVLIDGRSVYSPAFSGTFWDAQDTVLADVDRIEVVRGPGGSLWGANAVNGVINVITKSARDTQGFLIEGGAGTEERGFGTVRYGGQLSDDLWFRVYGKYFDRDSFAESQGSVANDSWNVLRGGFRADWEPESGDHFTIQGDAYDGTASHAIALSTLTPPFQSVGLDHSGISGGNVLGRFTHHFSKTSDAEVQLYVDHSKEGLLLDVRYDTVDLDFHHHVALSDVHDLVWGAGYRFIHDRLGAAPTVSVDPSGRDSDVVSVFAQDDITVVPDRFRLTVGSKFEHNDYTHPEFQPTVRALWTPTAKQSVWGAVSRAVRTPSRAEADARVNVATIPDTGGGVPGQVRFFGDHGFRSEELVAYELGYRVQATDRLSFDTAAFFNKYDSLLSSEPGTPFFETDPLPPHVVLPLRAENRLKAESYGVETSTTWSPTDSWKLHASYTGLLLFVHRADGSNDPNATTGEGLSPENQFNARSYFDLTDRLGVDVAAYYVDHLPANHVPSYVRLDLHLSWRPTDTVEIELGAQNLLDPQHPEFRDSSGIGFIGTEIQRSVYGVVTLRF